jgi:hypothetical protein
VERILGGNESFKLEFPSLGVSLPGLQRILLMLMEVILSLQDASRQLPKADFGSMDAAHLVVFKVQQTVWLLTSKALRF